MKKESLQQYRTRDWHKFREEVIRLHGGVCSVCGKSQSDGATLHVHHRQYIAGLKMWDYDYQDCEALCAGCHAAEHGIIPPRTGWQFDGYDDLGEQIGVCENGNCGHSIRYVFFVSHPKWRPLEVGEICCDNLTATTVASEFVGEIKRRIARLKAFASPKKWETLENGTIRRAFKSFQIAIFADSGRYGLRVNGHRGKGRFSDQLAAKQYAFKIIENGELKRYIEKKRREWNTF